MRTNSPFKDRLMQYFDLSDKHEEEKLNFFPEYVDVVKKAQKAIYVDLNYDEGEEILNQIPEDIRRVWEPSERLCIHIRYKKIIDGK